MHDSHSGCLPRYLDGNVTCYYRIFLKIQIQNRVFFHIIAVLKYMLQEEKMKPLKPEDRLVSAGLCSICQRGDE